MEHFGIVHLRQIRWSALDFFNMFDPNFNSFLNSFQHKAWLLKILKIHIHSLKVDKKIQKSDSRKKMFFHYFFSGANMMECLQYSELQFQCLGMGFGCNLTYFLEVGAYAQSGAATPTNLKN